MNGGGQDSQTCSFSPRKGGRALICKNEGVEIG